MLLHLVYIVAALVAATWLAATAVSLRRRYTALYQHRCVECNGYFMNDIDDPREDICDDCLTGYTDWHRERQG